MKLDELARTAAHLDEGKFRKQYPDPALVFLGSLSPIDESKAVDTPDGVDFNRTEAFRPLTNAGAYRVTAKTTKIREADETHEGPAPKKNFKILGASEIVFVAKTGRNPFANMITVGRAQNNDVILPFPSVSKLHAYFTHSGSRWSVTDQRSTNGTLVDDRPLPSGGTVELADGARIDFGPDAKAKFLLPESVFGFLSLHRAGVLKD